MKKILTLFAVSMTFLFASCSPLISIKANGDNSVDVTFKTGFSATTAKTLKSISGVPENEPLFHAGDMVKFLTEAGAFNVSAKVPNENEIQTSGSLKDLKKTAFYTTSILEQTLTPKKSLALTLGPDQIKRFYNLLDETSKSYIDMMMIPCLIDESMNIDEYRTLLSAMYGPTFANELVDGVVTIKLESPNGKNTIVTERLGEILTLTSEKSWTLDY